jgi:hypothetical protein
MLSQVLLLLAVTAGSWAASAFQSVGSDQTIVWGECPPNQDTTSFTMTCANLTFPLNYEDLSMGNVTAFVRRFYVNEPTDSGIWMVAGGPGDSSLPLVQACDYFLSSDLSFTCYCQDARGTGLSSSMTCPNQPGGPFNPYSAAAVNANRACLENIIATYGTRTKYYSAYNAMMDLAGAIVAIKPATVHIYAQSVGTYQLNTYLQLQDNSAPVDVLILDGPVPPNRWSLENNAEWASQVAQDVAYGCVTNSSVCRQRMSTMAHIPKLVMDSIVDQTLPCVRNISWLQGPSGQYWMSIYNNYCTGGASRDTAHLCLGPLWYRLHRCSASDIDQLNFFNAWYQTNMMVRKNYSIMSVCLSVLYS